MNTRICFRVAALAAGLTFAGFLTGCGGGDDGPSQVAPGGLEGRSYTFMPAGFGQTAVSFTSPTQYTFQHETGAIEQGTYEASRDGNNWTTRLVNTSGGQQIYIMSFTSQNGGSFVLKRESEEDRTGTFTARSTTIPDGDVDTDPVGTTNGSTTGTTSGTTTAASTSGSTTDGTTSGSTTTATTSGSTTTSTTSGSGTTTGPVTPSDVYTGNSPVSLAGRTMFGTRTFTSTGPDGQTHIYTFGNGTFHDSDAPEEADGNFTYNANNGSATLQLNYTSPADFAGDSHTLTMNFEQKDSGKFQSTYNRHDGTQIIINGDFYLQPIQ